MQTSHSQTLFIRHRLAKAARLHCCHAVGTETLSANRAKPFRYLLLLSSPSIICRERNDENWGKTEELRKKGQEPAWWHWVYGGTCFRLSQRVQTKSGRSLILSRGTVMTRGGIDALKQQLWAEAMRHGLGQAQEVLIIADGAVWIWNWRRTDFRPRVNGWIPGMRCNICGRWLMLCIRRMKLRRQLGSSL